MAALHFLNGKLVPEEKLLISPRDMGYARGYAVFDFLRTYNGKPFLLQKHCERLLNSAKIIGLAVPWGVPRISGWITQTIEANDKNSEKFVKITLSAAQANGLKPAPCDPTITIIVDPAPDYPASMYEKGIGMITVEFRRHLPLAKSNNYIEGVKSTVEAGKSGAYAPLYYSDVVHESCVSNIFAVIDGVLVTPKTHILPGITRNILLGILKLDIPVREQDFTLDYFKRATEAFSTDSGKEVVPVTSLDGKAVGSGKPGPVTREVMRQFRDFAYGNAW